MTDETDASDKQPAQSTQPLQPAQTAQTPAHSQDAQHTQSEPLSDAEQARLKLVEHIIDLEWHQFQLTNNEGGRAACQGNWPMFHQMRMSQFLTWPKTLLESYQKDLEESEQVGRNLVTEKYGRMMQSTVPQDFHENIEPYIPKLSDRRQAQQERIVAIQVDWADAFRQHYPKLGEAMRVLRTKEDTPETTSFETYLRGELGTYSQNTMDVYVQFIDNLSAQNRNITRETILNTVLLEGFTSLDEAEAVQ
jgi:hypothetical protein